MTALTCCATNANYKKTGCDAAASPNSHPPSSSPAQPTTTTSNFSFLSPPPPFPLHAALTNPLWGSCGTYGEVSLLPRRHSKWRLLSLLIYHPQQPDYCTEQRPHPATFSGSRDTFLFLLFRARHVASKFVTCSPCGTTRRGHSPCHTPESN